MQRTNTLYRVTTNENTLPFDEEAALGVLKYLDKDNLQELDDSNEKLEEHISDIDQVGIVTAHDPNHIQNMTRCYCVQSEF